MGKRRPQHPVFDAYDPLLDDDASETVDLHGMSAAEARQYLEQNFARIAARNRGRIVHLITGRGKGSRGGSVLRPLVRAFLAGTLATSVHEFQEDVARGGFRIRLK